MFRLIIRRKDDGTVVHAVPEPGSDGTSLQVLIKHALDLHDTYSKLKYDWSFAPVGSDFDIKVSDEADN